jgi:hypothetical protein
VYARWPGFVPDIADGLFAVNLADTRKRLGPNNWTYFLKKNTYVRQAMLVADKKSKSGIGCPLLGCGGTISSGEDGDKRW